MIHLSQKIILPPKKENQEMFIFRLSLQTKNNKSKKKEEISNPEVTPHNSEMGENIELISNEYWITNLKNKQENNPQNYSFSMEILRKIKQKIHINLRCELNEKNEKEIIVLLKADQTEKFIFFGVRVLLLVGNETEEMDFKEEGKIEEMEIRNEMNNTEQNQRMERIRNEIKENEKIEDDKRMKIEDSRVLPVFQSKNYFTILPGEQQMVRIILPFQKNQKNFILNVDGWNVKEQKVPLPCSKA